MDSILEKIVASKRIKIEAKAALGIYKAAEMKVCDYARKTVSMKKALAESPTGIIAEFKRRSPSRREIHPYASPAVIIPEYEKGGASACSVLTDTVYFGGSLSDLAVARHSASLPLLRKDFILDPRQLYEARLYGADAVLLIASCLGKSDICSLTAVAHELGLEVLLELHGENEIDKICEGVDMIGVNNRNLANFKTDIEQSAKMAQLLPDDVVKVTESGIKTMNEVRALREAGFRGFLIGTTFMERANPGVTLRHFINDIED